MRHKLAGVGAAVIAAIIVLVETGTGRVVDGLVEGEFGWAPQFDTAGQTAVAYMYASQAVTFVLSFVVVAALGYWAGRRLDVTTQYRSLIGALALGGVVGDLLGVGVTVWLVLDGSLAAITADPLFSLGTWAGAAVATAIHFALVGLAGAALAEFEFDPLTDRKSVTSSDDAVPDSS